MQVILQKSVVNLGEVGDVVTVKSGFARNYLFPKAMAVPVTAENQKILDAKRAVLEKEAAATLKAAQEKANAMADLKLVATVQANEQGELFGAISLNEVQRLFQEAGHEVEKRSLHIVQGQLKNTGTYNILVQLHAEVKFEIPLTITAENQVDAAVVEHHAALNADLTPDVEASTSEPDTSSTSA